MERVTIAEVHTDKQIVGDDVLEYSNQLEHVQQDVIITLKAEKKKDISDYARDVLNLFSRNEKRIHRIRVKGKHINGNDVVLDTGFLGKKEFVEAQQDEQTGEFDSNFMFLQLQNLARDF